MTKRERKSDNITKNEFKEELEVGKLEGDQPFYIDYGYTKEEWAHKLNLDRLNNKEWTDSGYTFNTEEA